MLSSTRELSNCWFRKVSAISCTSLRNPTLIAGIGSDEDKVGCGVEVSDEDTDDPEGAVCTTSFQNKYNKLTCTFGKK